MVIKAIHNVQLIGNVLIPYINHIVRYLTLSHLLIYNTIIDMENIYFLSLLSVTVYSRAHTVCRPICTV